MIKLNVKFFGPLRDVVKQDELTLELPDTSTGEAAFEQLASVYPELRAWRNSVRLAVNLEYTQFARALCSGDEVSFVPPVSGG